MGCSLQEIAPTVVAAVPQHTRTRRTVAEALQAHDWPADIRGLSLIGLFEFFQLWDILQETILTQDADVHLWRLEASGHFSSKSSYRVFLMVLLLSRLGVEFGDHGL
jgi:hypothetical protein